MKNPLRKTTVVTITAGLTKMVKDLEAHTAKQDLAVDRAKADVEAENARHAENLRRAQNAINAAAAERDQAAKIAANIKGLLT